MRYVNEISLQKGVARYYETLPTKPRTFVILGSLCYIQILLQIRRTHFAPTEMSLAVQNHDLISADN